MPTLPRPPRSPLAPDPSAANTALLSPYLPCTHFRLHKTLIKQLKYALVWGSSVKHRPQKVGKDHELHDEDIVQLVKKI